MNQTRVLPEAEKQGWLMRLVTAVTEKLLTQICQSELGLSPLETSRFLYRGGFNGCAGAEEAMMVEALTRMKWDEGVRS